MNTTINSSIFLFSFLYYIINAFVRFFKNYFFLPELDHLSLLNDCGNILEEFSNDYHTPSHTQKML